MSLHTQETLLIGSEEYFATVRHLVVRGTNYEIGKHLAGLAQERHGLHKGPVANPGVNHARRLYFQRNYPIHLDRARGVADAYGLRFEDDAVDPTTLLYAFPGASAGGCSVIYYPPQTTASGHGLLSRNYDFSTGSLPEVLGEPLPSGTKLPPVMGEPYVMEIYPDEGYPSLYLAGFDLLGACLDGINAEGLTVSLMGNVDLQNRCLPEPTLQPGVGLYELQVPRLLLDTCATVEEAKRALLLNKQYYWMMPCHYIIGDRQGHSFVWEYSPGHNREYIMDGDGTPQVVTNHPLSLPVRDQDASHESVRRYRMLRERIEGHPTRHSIDDLKHTNASVFADDMLMAHLQMAFRAGAPATRTLWHAIYDTSERSLQVSFYLTDEPRLEPPSQRRALRSAYYSFRLQDE